MRPVDPVEDPFDQEQPEQTDNTPVVQGAKEPTEFWPFGPPHGGPGGHGGTDTPPLSKIINTKEALDELICNIMRSGDNNVPEEVVYEVLGSGNLQTSWGTATSGVPLYNGISG